MQPEYVRIKQALIDRGLADRPMTDRGDLYETLRLVRKEGMNCEEFVDQMRLLLEAGSAREDAQMLEHEFSLQRGVRGCPVCHLLPSITKGAHVVISCPHHAPGVSVQAKTFPAALVEWNSDGEWLIDQDFTGSVDVTSDRPIYVMDLSVFDTQKNSL